MGKLNAIQVATLPIGKHSDGDGLYLDVTGEKTANWMSRGTVRGVGAKPREMGLGTARGPLAVSLKLAREKNIDAQKLRRDGIDPIEEKGKRAAAAKVETSKPVTFKAVAEEYIAAHKGGWTNAVHRDQWSSSLEQHVYPVIGNLSAGEITRADVERALKPIWNTIGETARRVRGRIEAVFDLAEVKGYRPEGTNPARLRPMTLMLGKQRRVVKHHRSLPYEDAPAMMSGLRKTDSTGSRCLQWVLLTAARTSEAINARFDQVNEANCVWTIEGTTIDEPGMKGLRQHRVPLSPAAMAIYKLQKERRENDYIFPGETGRNEGLSNNTLLAMLKRRGWHAKTVTHGLRSTLRDWGKEKTKFQREILEEVLHHQVGDETERAYARGDALDKRRRIMEAWAKYLGGAQRNAS